jgi:hypothetical protein
MSVKSYEALEMEAQMLFHTQQSCVVCAELAMITNGPIPRQLAHLLLLWTHCLLPGIVPFPLMCMAIRRPSTWVYMLLSKIKPTIWWTGHLHSCLW